MNVTYDLLYRIMTMAFPWNAWIMVMAIVNVGGGIFFSRTLEGILALVAMMVSFVMMAIIHARLGFVRLLGIGHILVWPPLVIWFLWTALSSSVSGPFRAWLLAVIVINSTSLLIDLVDIVRFMRGERDPIGSTTARATSL